MKLKLRAMLYTSMVADSVTVTNQKTRIPTLPQGLSTLALKYEKAGPQPPNSGKRLPSPNIDF